MALVALGAAAFTYVVMRLWNWLTATVVRLARHHFLAGARPAGAEQNSLRRVPRPPVRACTGAAA